MKTIELYICDKCEKMIPPSPHPNPPNGFVVEGNIYVAEPFEGGLVGDNFPKGSERPSAEDIRRSEIRKVCYCKDCFLEVLHLNPRRFEMTDLNFFYPFNFLLFRKPKAGETLNI